jgi:SagB-type dehydrogenase family enzyme
LNQPFPFKIYSDLTPIPLTPTMSPSDMPALFALSSTAAVLNQDFVPNLEDLSRLFHYSAGVTKKRDFGGGKILFRAAACTGALYHIEIYLVCADLPGLKAGVYHFDPGDHVLRCLRIGDYRHILNKACEDKRGGTSFPATVVLSSVYWRNAWKYQSRAYRHTYWDSGTIVANFQTVAASHSIPTRLVLNFIDQLVNDLLGLDTEKEVAIAVLPVGRSCEIKQTVGPNWSPLNLKVVPYSENEVDYPEIRSMHEASSLTSIHELAHIGPMPSMTRNPSVSARLIDITPFSDDSIPVDPVETVIRRRGSTRKFSRTPISFIQLSTILQRATTGIQADFLGPTGSGLSDIYITVHAVEGIPKGAYVYHKNVQALEMLEQGDFRHQSGSLGLDQDLPSDASANLFFLTDLTSVIGHLGNRGYRAAQIEASITAGKAYLAAYALGLGATGLTFYDDDVTAFFSPHADGKNTMFLLAIGHPFKQRST